MKAEKKKSSARVTNGVTNGSANVAARVIVNAHAVARLRSGHPWIFKSDIERLDQAAPGALLRVEDSRGKPFGSALYSSASQIALRMVAPNPVEAEKYTDLLRYRIPQAMDAEFARQILTEELRSAYQPETILERVDPRIRELEGLPAIEDRAAYSRLKKPKTATVFHLNGLAFHYDGRAGQKTGAFLDQRENYAAAQRHARGRALEICTYQGG